MSNITYLKGGILHYSHLPYHLSLFHNRSWFHCHHSYLLYCFKQLYFPHIKCGRAFTHIPTCLIIYIFRNYHVWPFTCTINLFQPFIWITIIFITQCNFQFFSSPSLLLSLLVTSYIFSSIAFFLLDTTKPFRSNFHPFLLYRLSEIEKKS